MFALWLRRVSLVMVVCGVVSLGWLAGTVRSDDSEKPERSVPVETPAEGEDEGNPALQAVGGLGIGHIQSTLGLIGVTADAFAKETYDTKKVEDLMNGTVNGIEAVKKLLRKLQDTTLSDDDEEFIDRMIGTYNALQREAKALSAFAKSRKPADAEAFEKARQAAVARLEQLTPEEEKSTSFDTTSGN